VRESALYSYYDEARVMTSLEVRDSAATMPGLVQRLTLGTLRVDRTGIAHKDSFARVWSKYPRLRVYNEDAPMRSADFDDAAHREPPLDDDGPDQLSPIARVYALVNEAKPRALWDSHNATIAYSGTVYERGAKLGHGTYGDVYRARNLVQGVPAVLKYLRPQKRHVNILAREVMVLRALGGKANAIALLDVTNEGNTTVLVMPEVHVTELSGEQWC
jgi:hypothetical protein